MPSIFPTYPLLRKAAPRLLRQFFTCQAAHNGPARAREAIRAPKNSAFLRAFRTKSPSALIASLEHGVNLGSTSPLSSLSKTIRDVRGGKRAGNSKESFFPETSDKIVAYWLLGSAAAVFGLVVFGGLTRLTESG